MNGIFIDFDGTLADSLPAMYNAYTGFLKSYGAVPTKEEFDFLNGPTLSDIILHLKSAHAIGDTSKNMQRAYLNFIQIAYKSVKPIDGAFDFLEYAHLNNYRMTIVTSSKRASVQNWLSTHAIDDFIFKVVGSEDVKIGKPHPDPYLTAINATDCNPNNSFAIEDSITGLRSATSAKLNTFFLGHDAIPDKIAAKVTRISSLRELIGTLDAL